MPVRLNGSTSGYVELAAPAVAGTTSLELPTDSIKPGLVLVAAQSFSAVSSVSVNNCFTATYENYRVLLRCSRSTSNVIQYRLRVSGTDSTTNYDLRSAVAAGTNSFTTSASTVQSSGYIQGMSSSDPTWAEMELSSPAIATPTFVSHRASSYVNDISLNLLYHNVSTAYDGITIFPSAGTITGTLRVYGYRNSL